MSERDESGQFTSAEPLTGIEGLEAESGYTSLASLEGASADEFADADDAAAAYIASQTPGHDDPIAMQLVEADTGEPMDESVTVSAERAANDIAQLQSEIGRDVETYVNADFAEQIDRMRAAELKNDPALEEHYGVKTPQIDKPATEGEAEAAAAVPENAGNDAPTTSETGWDNPHLGQALKDPKVVEAILAGEERANVAKSQHLQAVNNANLMSQAALATVVPELAGLPPEHFLAGMRQLAATNQPRFQTAMAVLNQMGQLQDAQQYENQRQQQIKQQNFEAYAKAEDKRLVQMLGAKDSEMNDLARGVVSYANELGIDTKTLQRLWQSEPIMRNAEFQRMMVDASKYNALKKAPPKATPRPLPPVQKPGVARSAGERASSNLSALAAKLDKSGSVDDAFALFMARSR